LPNSYFSLPNAFIGVVDIHRWRDGWRKSVGSDSKLWEQETRPDSVR
jgi:hypothetical protein